MSTFDDLLAHAHRLLDQRQDPFDDHVFCMRLAESPEAMEEVVRLRATLLQVESVKPRRKQRGKRLWAVSIAAAVLLFLLIPPKRFESDNDSRSIVKFSTTVAPAVIRFRHARTSTQLNPSPGNALFHVSVTSAQVANDFYR